MDRPKDKKDDKEMMSVPKAFKVLSPESLYRGCEHKHQTCKHDIAGPARACDKITQQPSLKTKIVLSSELSIIVPVCNGVYPAEENNGPGDQFVECDVLIKLNDTIQGRLTCQRDERSAYRENKDGDVEMKNQGSSSCNWVR